jgi:hypothetical protein
MEEAEAELRFITTEKLGSPLDPLLASLAHFSSAADLTAKVCACVCVCVRVCVCARACVRACVRACCLRACCVRLRA